MYRLSTIVLNVSISLAFDYSPVPGPLGIPGL
jgi:hypothetical protein